MRNIKLLGGLLGIGLAVTSIAGCKGTTFEAPELIEGVSLSKTITPVEYGIVGGNTMDCLVTAAEDNYFFETNCEISEICVQRGQYVEKGTVLAVANTTQAVKNIEELNKAIASMNREAGMADELYIYDHQLLELDLVLSKDACDEESVKEIEKQMLTLEENNHYDVLYREYQISNLRKQIGEEQKLVENGKLVARESGYVSYIFDLSRDNHYLVGNTVVSITKPEELYLSSGVKVVDKPKEKWTYSAMIDGVRYPLTTMPYTQEEKVIADNKGVDLFERFLLPENVKYPPLGSYLICYAAPANESNRQEVLRVMSDGIYRDDFGSFVYVYQDGMTEQRYVKIGKSADDYTEIKDGLSEGEWITYKSKDLMPAEYETVTATSEKYGYEISTANFTEAPCILEIGKSKWNGKLKTIEVNEGDYVEEGTLLLTIQTDLGSAKIAELNAEIDNLQRDHELYVKSYEDRLKGIDEEKRMYANMQAEEINIVWQQYPEPEEDETDGEEEEDDLPTPEEISQERQRLLDAIERKYGFLFKKADIHLKMAEIQDQQMKAAYEENLSRVRKELSEIRNQNDGAGVFQIYAKSSGYFAPEKIKVGDDVYEEEILFRIQGKQENIIRMGVENNLPIGKKVALRHKETGKEVEGIVRATDGDNLPRITELAGKIYVTTNSMTRPHLYIEIPETFDMEELTQYKMYYKEEEYENVVNVPKGTVKIQSIEGSSIQLYYVWKIVDGNMVKQYVEKNDGKLQEEVICIKDGLKPGDVYVVD